MTILERESWGITYSIKDGGK